MLHRLSIHNLSQKIAKNLSEFGCEEEGNSVVSRNGYDKSVFTDAEEIDHSDDDFYD